MIRTRIRVTSDGTLSGRAQGIPAGEHDAEITVIDTTGASQRLDVADLLARIQKIQEEVARLPVLDNRTPDEIIGYNERGYFD